ncbi:MAG: hypothetical protein IKT63_01050 [Oscillospiraceae bacterium]|nr:hypothetical protein [Oscillospiraceae bacterium]
MKKPLAFAASQSAGLLVLLVTKVRKEANFVRYKKALSMPTDKDKTPLSSDKGVFY